MIKTIKNTFSAIQGYWRPILLENPGALIAAVLAIPSAFLADYFASNTDIINLLTGGEIFEGASYLIAFIIVLIIYLLGVLFETRKFIFYNRRIIHLPVVVNIANNIDSQNALKIFVQSLSERSNSKITKINNNYLYELERYLAIASEDLVFQYDVDINDPSKLYDIFAVIRHNLTRLQKQTPKNHVLEVAYIGPVAIAIWLGAITHTESIALWPYDRSSEQSYPERITILGNINSWSSSETPQKTKQSLIFNDQENPKKWLVALDLSGKPRLSLQHSDLCEFKNSLYICGAHGDVNIATNEYLQYAKEIYDAILKLEREYPQSSIHLVCAIPTILAILVGRAINTIFSVEVTHYNRETQSYSVLFKLNDSRFRYQHI